MTAIVELNIELTRLRKIETAARVLDILERQADPSGPGIANRGAAWRKLQEALGNP